MTRPTLTQTECWRPEALGRVAAEWDRLAGQLQADLDTVARETDAARGGWTGAAAQSARAKLAELTAAVTAEARALVASAVAARDGAARLAAARAAVLDAVAAARSDGYIVADDGTVSAPGVVPGLARLAFGGSADLAGAGMATRATEFTAAIGSALDGLAAADIDTAHDIDEAFTAVIPPSPPTLPAGSWPVVAADVVAGWPSMSQDRIAAQIAQMTPEQRQHLIEAAPRQVGNTDGVPWPMRIAANRTNIADAILHERKTIDRPEADKIRDVLTHGLDPVTAERFALAVQTDPSWRAAAIASHDREANRRIAFYQGLLAEVPDPTRRNGGPVDRQVLAFDPDRSSFVELVGEMDRADSVGVLVPGLNTTVLGSAPNTETARRFVAAGAGKVAMITYLGGPFPTGGPVSGIVHAADPHYALDMAPRLVAFSEDVNRTVDGTGRSIPVTYIGHSYGGSILGTAESQGLTADRTIYTEAAGAGVGVHDPGDWHNRNPDVLRYSMTAPGDPIEAVQGLPSGPHGADPDELAGVVRLDTGRRLDGSVMSGLRAHSDVLTEPSDAWRNILGVITGDRGLIHPLEEAG